MLKEEMTRIRSLVVEGGVTYSLTMKVPLTQAGGGAGVAARPAGDTGALGMRKVGHLGLVETPEPWV